MFFFREPSIDYFNALDFLETLEVDYWLIDENVFDLYKERVSIWNRRNVFRVKAGEEWKNVEGLQEIWEWFYQKKVSRESVVGVVGGGMTLDLGALAVSTWHRGASLILVPTTLLAQVDAAHGGKTACNFHQRKNAIGTFYFPIAVMVSSAFLSTLAPVHIRSGIGEMVKHALLDSESHFQALVQYFQSGDWKKVPWLTLIQRSIYVKMEYVRKDPYEIKGERSALNLGHTIGHALESWAIENQYSWEHGECVFVGLIVELLFSQNSESPVVQSLVSLYCALGYSPSLDQVSFEDLKPYLIYDKKRKKDGLRVVLWKTYGETEFYLVHNQARWRQLAEAYETAKRLIAGHSG